ncbi:HPP family protein [Patulibacter brassicae]|uniref:HPP family protein n=1 Tax=Patulibacter brassicae TaxID=1705717 RepID=A0ABU4VKX9_9ACTN|nr:HPP family protein [Patulibacter brassicae]MDX8152339.1 HPP family protein [Patulibacter brassicae]
MPLLDVPAPLVPYLRMAVGVFCSAVLIAAMGRVLDMPLLMAPFLATAALKHSAPHLPGVAPRRVVGGHVVGAVAGVAVGNLLGVGALAMALAAAGAAVAMMRLDVLHAPGVATAAVAIQYHGQIWFPLAVVLAGAATLVATTMLLTPLLHGHRYPVPRPRRGEPVAATS